MASRKRAADRQLTKDDADEEETTVEMTGTWQEAPPEKLAERKIVKAKRKKPADDGESKPSGPMPLFDFGVGAKKEEEKKEEKKEEEEKKQEEKKEEGTGLAEDNPLAKFLRKQGQWDCPSCMLTNQPDAKKCIACETPNPNAEGGAEGKEKSAADIVAAAGITFGAPAPSSSSAGSGDASKPLFSWGGGSDATAAPSGSSGSGGFSFGFSFGSGPVSFGAVASQAKEGEGFTFKVADGQDENKDKDKDKDSQQAGFTFGATSEVAAEFKDKQPEKTGEEDDTIELKTHARVFQLKMVVPQQGQPLPKDEDDEKEKEKKPKEEEEKEKKQEEVPVDLTPKPKFVEQGSGELHLNTYTGPDGKKRARLVMRVDKTQRLVLNTAVFPAMKWQHNKEDKSVRLVSTDLEGKMGATYALKFKTKEDASAFADKLREVIDSLKEQKEEQ